jgi:hypothetical protein
MKTSLTTIRAQTTGTRLLYFAGAIAGVLASNTQQREWQGQVFKNGHYSPRCGHVIPAPQLPRAKRGGTGKTGFFTQIFIG